MATIIADDSRPVALVTGGSRGFGLALVEALAARGWRVITDARDGDRLSAALGHLTGTGRVTAIAGDIADAAHRRSLAAAVEGAGRLDLLVNNASVLGPSPLQRLDAYDAAALETVLLVNTIAPLALSQALLPHLHAPQGCIVNVTSDAAVEAYPGWGGYGASKAALDQLSAVLAAENPELRVYAFDPGDMRTEMHQAAFPGEDISDRPEPVTVVPALLRLLDEWRPSGRYRCADVAEVVA